MASKSLTFDIFGKDKTASKTIRGVGDAAEGMGKKFKSMAAGIGLALGAAAVANWAKGTIEDLGKIEVINAQTEAVIKSTGGSANVTGKHIEDMAGKLEKLTATEGESIQEGANLLLTFKNIRNETGKGNDIFDQTVVAMTDMARAMGTDAKGGALQLGKALNDPIAGIAALSRVGITFSDSQKELIKTLVESGDVMGAQKIILAELNAQFGGSGAAYADTYRGKLELLEHKWGDISEKIIINVMPALEKMVDFVDSDVLPALDDIADWFVADGIPAIEEGVAWVTQWKDVLGPAAVAVGVLTAAQWLLNAAMLANPFGLALLGLSLLVAQGALVIINFESIFKAVYTFGQGVFGFASGIAIAVSGVAESMVNSFIGGINAMLGPLNNLLSVLGMPTLKLGNVDFTSGLKKNAALVAGSSADAVWSASQGNTSFSRNFASPAGKNLNSRGHYTLAEGGIVRATPGGVSATIGEGRYDEVVLPLSDQVLSKLGGNSSNVTFNVTTSDPRLAAEAVYQRLRTGLVRV